MQLKTFNDLSWIPHVVTGIIRRAWLLFRYRTRIGIVGSYKDREIIPLNSTFQQEQPEDIVSDQQRREAWIDVLLYKCEMPYFFPCDDDCVYKCG